MNGYIDISRCSRDYSRTFPTTPENLIKKCGGRAMRLMNGGIQKEKGNQWADDGSVNYVKNMLRK